MLTDSEKTALQTIQQQIHEVLGLSQIKEGSYHCGKLPKIYIWDRILFFFGFRNSKLLLYSISKCDPETIELTVLQGRGRTLRLKTEEALFLASNLIDHALQ